MSMGSGISQRVNQQGMAHTLIALRQRRPAAVMWKPGGGRVNYDDRANPLVSLQGRRVVVHDDIRFGFAAYTPAFSGAGMVVRASILAALPPRQLACSGHVAP